MTMKNKLLVDVLIGIGCLLIVACVALSRAEAPPRTDKLYSDIDITDSYDGEICVWIQGEGVENPGMYRLPYGSTYGDLFLLARAEGSTVYDPSDRISFADAVLIGGEYCIYIVI